jgi:glycosyltransferase involved in cell wall biosynthesis
VVLAKDETEFTNDAERKCMTQLCQCRPTRLSAVSIGSKIKPNVLIIIGTAPIGGPGKGLFQFIKYAPHDSYAYVLCNFKLKNLPQGEFVERARRDRVNLILLEQRVKYDPGLIFQARRIIREHGINLVQTHGYKAHVLGFFLRLFYACPWICFSHGYIYSNWKMNLFNWIDRKVLLHGSDRVVAVSGSMKDLLIRNGINKQKIRLIYNAIDTDEAVPTSTREEIKQRHGLTPENKVVGVIGRLNPEKGQMVLLRAMEKTVRSCPDVKVLIIGEGQERSALERFARERGLSEHAIFVGYQAYIADYYQILDLLVLPSLSEGLPNTVLEGMTFGIPVLATSVGGVPEIIQNGNGVLVPPNDPDALAERMIELLKNDSLRRAIGLKGKSSLYPRFAPDHRARQIIDLYEELLSSRVKP